MESAERGIARDRDRWLAWWSVSFRFVSSCFFSCRVVDWARGTWDPDEVDWDGECTDADVNEREQKSPFGEGGC